MDNPHEISPNTELKSQEPVVHNYKIPVKCVKSMEDMPAWQRSEAYYDLIGFINGISVSIQGKKISDNYPVSALMKNLVEIFDTLNKLVDDTPPMEEPQRFGNQSYREWYRKMQNNAEILMKEALTAEFSNATPEIAFYFIKSFGNQTRIDYGTGHELSFIMFLCSLYKIKALNEKDNLACGLKLFNTYLIFVRRLQVTYRMEPAGSQGVWSLDDYQFIPFLWGSAQLSINSPIEPHKFMEKKVIEQYKDDYMFISCIDYICKTKSGLFAEHSNQLWNISGVQSWSKINSGLVKMYQKEILSKFPVIQHLQFGTLMSFKAVDPGRMLSTVRLGMITSDAPKMFSHSRGFGDFT